MALIGLDSTGAGGPREALALSNADAAHACNQGGYQHYLRGSDLTPFKNAGDCVSYATRTGNVLVPACTPSTADAIGCLTFSNLTLPDTSSSITLNGVITFTT